VLGQLRRQGSSADHAITAFRPVLASGPSPSFSFFDRYDSVIIHPIISKASPRRIHLRGCLRISWREWRKRSVAPFAAKVMGGLTLIAEVPFATATESMSVRANYSRGSPKFRIMTGLLGTDLPKEDAELSSASPEPD